MNRLLPPRRAVLLGASAALISGCDGISRAPEARRFLAQGERLTQSAQRALLSNQPLAREFSAAQISHAFKVNGSSAPSGAAYLAIAAENFADFRLEVTGLVTRPLRLSLNELRAMPARTQITRHDCVEGWSCIGQWTGVPLGDVLLRAGLADHARFIVFHCADELGRQPERYYESIDLFDAFHPQTILAYGMNGGDLPIEHGAPLRLRVERQLGYKQAKFVMHVEAVERLDTLRGGKGGYWEDRGYEWYAGI